MANLKLAATLEDTLNEALWELGKKELIRTGLYDRPYGVNEYITLEEYAYRVISTSLPSSLSKDMVFYLLEDEIEKRYQNWLQEDIEEKSND